METLTREGTSVLRSSLAASGAFVEVEIDGKDEIVIAETQAPDFSKTVAMKLALKSERNDH